MSMMLALVIAYVYSNSFVLTDGKLLLYIINILVFAPFIAHGTFMWLDFILNPSDIVNLSMFHIAYLDF